jgi:hypothetical protein
MDEGGGLLFLFILLFLIKLVTDFFGEGEITMAPILGPVRHERFSTDEA